MAKIDGSEVIPAEWQRELSHGFTHLQALGEAIGAPLPSTSPAAAMAMAQFPLRVPRGFVARMRRHDPDDPLLRQILPTAEETQPTAGFSDDPLREVGRLSGPGVLRKYRGRALLLTTGACAINCRFCFRRAFPYAQAALTAADLSAACDVIRADHTLTEIILSGGDPLTLSDIRLGHILAALDGIDHVRRIRIHTRVPVVLPERINDLLLEQLAGLRKPVVMVLHCNHAQEIDASVAHATERLRPAVRSLLNQSVLLRGVNDSVQALVELSEALFDIQVLPYYLHLLDAVNGAAHFQVSEEQGRRLLGEAATQLPGYLVPRLVREDPEAAAKVILAPQRHNNEFPP